VKKVSSDLSDLADLSDLSEMSDLSSSWFCLFCSVAPTIFACCRRDKYIGSISITLVSSDETL
jgi:hypothetical protein